MKIVVIGLGYLGATHASCMAQLGHDVLGVEVDEDRRQSLQAGLLPFYEPGLSEMLREQLDAGNLRITSSYQEAAEWGEAFFIAVGTPQRKGENAADLRFVDQAVDTLVPLLTRNALIIGKSTVPVGTSSRLSDRAAAHAKDDVRVEVAWNPEFLREGHAIDDTLTPDRLVLGVDGEGIAERLIRTIYAPLIDRGTPLLVMDTASAEMVKVAANSFLATKISFINAIAEVCEAAGADVRSVAEAIGHDDRIGPKFLNAGLGFGGGCLPKDIRAFMARAGELGASEALAFLREVDNVNMRRRERVVDVAKKHFGGVLIGRRVAVWGAAFKPNSDDVRDSPALSVAGQLQLRGASVTVYDPKAMAQSAKVFPTLQYANSSIDACDQAELLLVLTEWPEFVSCSPSRLNPYVRQRVVFDGRNCLDRSLWENAGWKYIT
ncbi:UDP-glucose/GDP-mannose dehydrogenase family protein [Gordonia sp. AC31]|uniref:UDP-glucose dehydrogenase family protein n=1 Tax=Gordonia sp. AC31 TaxID=2962571 RepID=UPI002880DF14|nr:UDP-glucose/GDP-mannose dehydrogenase family protein [Gordonia sp. AC31]MDT0223425.1 UDP-glucose/GDP-mannose dehydrogenase family protein [Gordonia sp. AC31]